MSSSRLTIEAWPISDAGQSGGTNDDTILVHIPDDERERRYAGSLYIVADGSGGAEQAALASQYAAKRIAHAYYTSDEPDLGLRLRTAIAQANEELFEYAKTRPELVKLGTTLTAAVVRGEQMHVANVGDSRAYLVRNGDIQQITRDHTLVQQLIDEGAISPDEAADHPRSEVVLRTLGSEPKVDVDVFDVRLKADDAFVLASDGLTRRVGHDEILRVISTQSPRNAADSLIQRARLKGGEMNTSVVAALVRDGAPPMTTDLPYSWDGTKPAFGEAKMLPGTDLSTEEPPIPEASTAQASAVDATQQMKAPTMPQYQQRQEPAPEFRQQEEPRQTEPSRPQRPTPPRETVPAGQQPPYQPPGDYQPYAGNVDPVTGLPPTPQQGGQQQQQPPPPQYQQPPPQYQQQPPQYQQYGSGPPQYGPRGYDPQGNNNNNRGGIIAAIAAFGIFAIIISAMLIVFVINPFGIDFAAIGGNNNVTDVDIEATVAALGTQQAAAVDGGGDAPTDSGGGTDGGTSPTQGAATDGGGAQPTATPESAQPTPTQQVAEETGPVGMKLIAEGDYLRGVPTEEIDEAVRVCINEDPTADNVSCIRSYFEDAQPVESVTMSGFYMDTFEVTNAQYGLCVTAEVCSPPSNVTFFNDPAFANHPVVYVNWDQAVAYCSFQGKRLPTEAEWEKAARWDELLQQSNTYPWGNTFQQGIANIGGIRDGTTPVSDFENDVSPWGVRQMGGNVSEWVQDWYFPGYEDQATLNPVGPGEAPLATPLKIIRGGSFNAFQSYSRAGHRLDLNRATQAEDVGIRCAADLGANITSSGGSTTPTETPAP